MPETLIHPPRTMLEVWQSLPEGTLCQLINNELIMSPAPLDIHQIVLGEIYLEIGFYLRKYKIGQIRFAPSDVHFSNANILQPDLLFIKNENLPKMKRNGFYGAPDLIIEVLSPTTSGFDYDQKKSVYERFGVEEYFIVEPNTKSVDSFFLKDGQYEEQETIIGKINSKILGSEISFLG